MNKYFKNRIFSFALIVALLLALLPTLPMTVAKADDVSVEGANIRFESSDQGFWSGGGVAHMDGDSPGPGGYKPNPELLEITDFDGNPVVLEIDEDKSAVTQGVIDFGFSSIEEFFDALGEIMGWNTIEDAIAFMGPFPTIAVFKGVDDGSGTLKPILEGSYLFKLYKETKGDEDDIICSGLLEIKSGTSNTFRFAPLVIEVLSPSGVPFDSSIEVYNNQKELMKPLAEYRADIGARIQKIQDYITIMNQQYEYNVMPEAPYHENYNIVSDVYNSTVGSASKINVAHTLNIDTVIKVTKGADTGVYFKSGKHYAPFRIMSGVKTSSDDSYDFWTFKLAKNTAYHVETSIPGVTVKEGWRFKLPNTFQGGDTLFTIDLTPLENYVPPSYDVVAITEYMEANLYTNLDDSGSINMSSGQTERLDMFRVWQPMAGSTENYFIEPDYNFEVVGDRNITLTKQGTAGRILQNITATGNGVSVIKITYDPINYVIGDGLTTSGRALSYRAIDPLNTGIAVINVDGGSDIDTGITSRNDFDTWYFDRAQTDHARYTFTPEADVKVRVHKPIHDGTGVDWGDGWSDYYRSNDDGSYTIALYEGRSIVEVTKGSSRRYHVLSARGLDVTVSGTKAVGNVVQISFEGLTIPIQKMGGIYNPGYGGTVYLWYTTPVGGEFTGKGAAYDFINDHTLTYSINEADMGVLTGGKIHCGAYGNRAGAHRYISLSGVSANMNADSYGGDSFFGALPDIYLLGEAPELPPLKFEGDDSDDPGDPEDTGDTTIIIAPLGGNTIASGSALVIRNAAGTRISPVSGKTNEYLLESGKTYNYYYTAPGYLVVTDSFSVAESTKRIDISAPTAHNQSAGKANVTVVGSQSVLRENQEISYTPDTGLNLYTQGYVDHNNGGYTVLHTLLDSFNTTNVKIPFTCYKGIPTVSGITLGGGAGWVCEVNGTVVPANELATTLVSNGDSIKYYYIAGASTTQNAWFENSSVTVKAGEGAALKLIGSAVKNDGTAAQGIADAEIFVNGQSTNVKSGSDGSITIPTSLIPTAGNYMIMARKTVGGNNILVFNQALIRVEKGSSGTTPVTTTVTFRLIGDDMNSPDSSVTNPAYVNWIPTRSYTFSKASVSVEELFKKALSDAKLGYIDASGGDYISGIQAPSVYGGKYLSEFDRGENSGWMYTVNGDHPNRGLMNWYVTDGDVIIWHYVYDYIKETGFEGQQGQYPNLWLQAPDDPLPKEPSKPSGTGDMGSGSASSESSVTETVTTTPTIGGEGVATAKPKTEDIAKALETVKKGLESENSGALGEITIAVDSKNADKLILTIPGSNVKEIAQGGNIQLTVESGLGTVTIDHNTLRGLTGGSGGDLTVTIERVDPDTLTDAQKAIVGDNPVFDLSVSVGGNIVHNFDGTVTVFLPFETDKADSMTVYYLAEDGKVTEMEDVKYDAKRKGFVFTTKHFSLFFIAEATSDTAELPFTDVNATDWFYNAVKYAFENALMNGISATEFAPDNQLTRAMLVTILHRYEGEPTITGGVEFTDVPTNEWYTDAIAWASANGIVNGYGDGIFGTNDNITREQLATMLYNYATFKKLDVSKTTDLASFTDRSEVSEWALEAMQWANAEGLVNGRTAETLVPEGTATRAEAATLLMRFIEEFVKK